MKQLWAAMILCYVVGGNGSQTRRSIGQLGVSVRFDLFPTPVTFPYRIYILFDDVMVAPCNSIVVEKHQSNMLIKRHASFLGTDHIALEEELVKQVERRHFSAYCLCFAYFFCNRLGASCVWFFVSLEILRSALWDRGRRKKKEKSFRLFRKVTRVFGTFFYRFFPCCSFYLFSTLTLICIFVDSIEIHVLESLLLSDYLLLSLSLSFFFSFFFLVILVGNQKVVAGSSFRLAKLAIEFCRQFQRADVSWL